MYAGWSAPLFFANPENRFSRFEDQIVVYHVVLFGVVFNVLNLFHRFQMKRLSMYIKKNVQKKEEGKYQGSIQSSITHDTGHHMRKC